MRDFKKWCLVLGPLALLASCDVSVGDCRQDDAGQCVDLFPNSGLDAGLGNRHAGPSAAADASSVRSDSGLADAGIDGGSPVIDSGAPLATIASFCDAINSRGLLWADKLDQCCAIPAERSSTTASGVLNLIGAYSDQAADGCITFYGGLITAGTVTFDPAPSAACVSAFLAAYQLPAAECPAAGYELEQLRSTIGHGAPQLAQIEACRDTLRGKTAQGQQCTRNFECGKGLTCMPIASATTAGSTCRPPSTANELCDNSGNCAAGLVCVGSKDFGRVCRAVNELADLGGGCAASQECVVGQVCGATNKCGLPTAGTAICKQ